MNIGDLIISQIKYIYPYNLDLYKDKESGKLFGNWLGAYWFGCSEGNYKLASSSQTLVSYMGYINKPIPYHKQYYFPNRPEYLGEIKTKDYFLENLRKGVYNSILGFYIPHSLLSFCNFMYGEIYQHWLLNDKSSHYNPISYVGHFLKHNQIEFKNRHWLFNEVMNDYQQELEAKGLLYG